MKRISIALILVISLSLLCCDDEKEIIKEDKVNNGHEYVDLGLSVMWATCNINANKPEEYGSYYAWAEMDTKSEYSSDKYRYYGQTPDATLISKYNYNRKYGINDGRYTLLSEDDVVHKTWKGDWRIPTSQEYDELLNNCSWSWTIQNGINGYKVTSKRPGYTDKSIFLPAAGYYFGPTNPCDGTYGCYWSSSLNTYDPYNADHLFFTNEIHVAQSSQRQYGLAIRPVFTSESWDGITSIKIDKDSLVLSLYDSYILTASIDNNIDGFIYAPKWYSDNIDVVSVNDYGLVKALSHGTATITATCLGKTAYCKITVKDPLPVNEAVDLGLSVKWATCNIGSSQPSDPGYYYAWGETSTKQSFTWINYKYYLIKDKTYGIVLSKYTSRKYWDGYNPDYKTRLEIVDDAAHVNWGGDWRIPTAEECKELRDNCIWTKTNINGIEGYKITSKRTNYSDRSIFLPAAGYMNDTGIQSYGISAYYPSDSIVSDLKSTGLNYASIERYIGIPIRPVRSSETWEGITDFFIERDTISLFVGSVDTLHAIIRSGIDDVKYDVKWYSSNTDIITVTNLGAIRAVSSGEAIITAECRDKKTECVVRVKNYTHNNHDYVDLGLSVKWATYNIGATNIEDVGDVFAWGEIDSKNDYSWSNYKFGNYEEYSLIKYCNTDTYGYNGYVDDLTTLTQEDDVASVNWGGNWRIPTKEEVSELRSNCNLTKITINGIECCKLTSKVYGYGNVYIIIPYSSYWSSDMHSNPECAWSWSIGFNFAVVNRYRYYGYAIRPVCQ